MINKNNKGMVLGITFISMLSILLITSVIFTIILSKTLAYKRYIDRVQNRIIISRYAQDVYVNLKNDIQENEVLPDEYAVDDLTVYRINDYYEYQIEYNDLIILVRLELTGEIITWKIT